MEKIEQTVRDGSTEYNKHFFYKKPEPQSICSVKNTKCLTQAESTFLSITLTEMTILKNIFNRFTLLFIKFFKEVLEMAVIHIQTALNLTFHNSECS